MGYSTVQNATLIDSRSCQVTSRFILYLKGKYRIDVKVGGKGVRVNKSIFRRPLNIIIILVRPFMCLCSVQNLLFCSRSVLIKRDIANAQKKQKEENHLWCENTIKTYQLKC